MDENLHKDPLEDLFRKNLEDQNLEKREAARDEWDLPSDGLWDKIGNTVEFTPPAKGIWLSSKMQAIAIAASVLLALGVFTCFRSYQNQLNSLTQRVEELSAPASTQKTDTPVDLNSPATISKKEDPFSKKQSIDQSSSNESDFAQELNLESIPRLREANPNPNVSENSNTNNQDINTIAASPPVIPFNPKNNLQEENQEPLLNQNSWIATEQNSVIASPNDPTNVDLLFPPAVENQEPLTPSIAWTPLVTLPSTTIALLEQSNPTIAIQNNAIPPLIKPFRKQSSKGFYAGLFYAPTNTIIGIQDFDKKNPGPGKFKKAKTIFSHMEGLKFGYQIDNNWAIEMEGRYGATKINRKDPVRLTYSKQKERKEGRFYRGEYSSRVSTAYGDIDTDIVLYRESGTTVPDQAAVAMVVESEQDLRVLSIPVVAKYSFGEGPIRVSARAGIAANFILKDDVDLTVSTIDRSGLSSRSSRFFPKRKGLGKNNVEFLTGIGLEYQAGSHWRISLEPSFSRAITPVYKHNGFVAAPKKVSVALGVNYQF